MLDGDDKFPRVDSETSDDMDGERRRLVRKSFRQREGCLRIIAGPDSMAPVEEGVAVGNKRMVRMVVVRKVEGSTGEWRK